MMRKLFLALTLCTFSGLGQAATLYVSEFKNYPGIYQAPLAPEVTHQTVAIGGSSARSNPFNVQTQLIEIVCDTTCSVQVGSTTPTATTSSHRMAAGVPEFFIVQPGDEVAVISNS